MDVRNNVTGSCICGAVTVTAKTVSTHVGACHCETCRKWGGGPMLTVDCGSEVSFTGADAVARYASSEWAERGFCSICGTHLYYKLKHNNQHIMPAGLFDVGDAEFDFDHQIFVDNKPGYYEFANQTQDKTGAELFAEASVLDS